MWGRRQVHVGSFAPNLDGKRHAGLSVLPYFHAQQNKTR